MSVSKKSKSVALLSAIACSVCLFWAVSASAMEGDSMSHDQTTGMQDDKAAKGMPEGDDMSHDNGISDDSMDKDDSMSSDDSMKKDDSMSEDDSMSSDDSMDKDDSM